MNRTMCFLITILYFINSFLAFGIGIGSVKNLIGTTAAFVVWILSTFGFLVILWRLA